MYIEYLPGEKHAIKGADKSDRHDRFEDCGYLLETNDIVVDIDHLPLDSIKAMIKEFNINTQMVWTDRGVHLYFTKGVNSRAGSGVCRLGFPIEILTKQTRPNGITIKRNGVLRKIDNEGKRQVIPSIFTIGYKTKHKKKIQFDDLTGLDDGERRNDNLFIHRNRLAGCDGWEKILRFINQWVFATPMSDDEMASIMRDNVNTNESVGAETSVVEQIMEQCKPILYHKSMWWYKGNQYICDSDHSQMQNRIYQAEKDLKTSFVDEVIKRITYQCPRYDDDAVFAIRFRNGILDDGEFYEMDEYTDFTPYFVDIDYDTDCPAVAVVDDYIAKLTSSDPEYRRYLMQVLGFAFVTDPEKIRALGKFFIFRGDGGNGKGTLFKIMQRIYDKKNCSALTIKQLCDQRQATSLIGKLANLGDDIEPDAINDDQLKMLKNISTCDTISMRFLYQEAFTTSITTKLFFTSNHDIKSFDKGYAFKRRIVWMPMFTKVDKPDPKFISKLTSEDALRYWIKLMVEGYIDLYQNDWVSCKVVDDYNAAYHENNNGMMLFAKSLDLQDDILGKTIKGIENTFREWDMEDARFSSKMFKQAVWELHKAGMGVARINGKTAKVFMLQSETTQNIAP